MWLDVCLLTKWLENSCSGWFISPSTKSCSVLAYASFTASFSCCSFSLLQIVDPQWYEWRALPDGPCTVGVLPPLSVCSLVCWILSLKQELPSVDNVWDGGCDCRVEECAASLLPACGSSTTCTLRALHGWFLCHHSVGLHSEALDIKDPSLCGRVIAWGCWDWCEVDPGSQGCTQPVQSSAVVQWELLCFVHVMSNLGRSPGFLNNVVCCYLFLPLWKPWYWFRGGRWCLATSTSIVI